MSTNFSRFELRQVLAVVYREILLLDPPVVHYIALTCSCRALQPLFWRPKLMPEIYIYAIEGRSVDQKRALIQDITAATAKHFKVEPDTVMIQIIESPKENKAKGGIIFSERDIEQRKL